MARPATSRLKVNPPLGRMPVLQFCPPGELQVDGTYQRGMEEARSVSLIRQIAQHWNWDLCQPLVVARRAGGELFVIDGQHRLEAARMRGDLAQLPCVVVEYTSAADEAASFVHLNQQRKPLTKLDLFRAAVASEDPQAVAIVSALTGAGLSLAPHSNYTAWKPGMVANIAGIERAWARHGAAVATRALDAMGHAWAGQVLRYAGSLYRGLVRICLDETREHGSFRGERFERFLTLLSRQSQEGWMKDVNRYFANHPEMFRGEAAEGLLRQEWRRTLGGRTQALPAPDDAPIIPPNGFCLGAADDKSEPERAWCSQCDRRVTAEKVGACLSKFCPLKVAA